MSRFYDRVIKPGYFHGLKLLRLLVFPLAAAGGFAWIGREIFGLPLAAQIVLMVLGAAVGVSSWLADYSGESSASK